MAKKICRHFATRGSCRFNPCRFEHDPESRSSGQTQQRRNDDRGEFAAFGAWRAQASNGYLGSIRTPIRLGPFFKEARRLIGTDESTRQNVIRHLSTEEGLRPIQGLIEREFSSLSPSQKKTVFEDGMIAFLEIITSPDVLASLVVEQAVVTIYNCIFGPLGRRAGPLLDFLADIVEIEVGENQILACSHLELSLLAFSQVIRLNSTAFVQDSLHPPAQKFADLLTTLHALNCDYSLYQSLQYLEIIQRHLDVGLSLPNLMGHKIIQTTQAPTGFITQKDPPGGRHDNDYADISKIKIMPTFEEISSSRAEYLPVRDCRQWHLNGIAGLLDRNFRLLREDTIGQLRDVIHAELQLGTRQDNRRNQTRTHVYSKVRVQTVDLHRFSGLQFLVTFSQPSNIRGLDKKKREDWWNFSKRLQSSALVCLLDPKGFAIFCTVAGADRPHKKEDGKTGRWKVPPSLSENSQNASVILELVEPTAENWKFIFDCQAAKNARQHLAISLVEFPGILLPSFQPTLLALQNMQKASDVPMSEFLAAGNLNSQVIMAEIPPPIYATSPGFAFDLKCLMNDRSSLEVKHSQPVDIERLQQHSTLDDAQAVALVKTLQRRIGCIQGPPGTGKSYTGVALINVLLANKAKVKAGLGPIVCVCYTNHALDQLLGDILENKITTQIIRIGSQSKSERLEPFNLRTVAREVERTRLEKKGQWELHAKFDSHDEGFQNLHLNSSGSDASLTYYLRDFHPQFYRQFFGKDKQGFQRTAKKNPGQTIRAWLDSGKISENPPRSLTLLYRVQIDMMTAQERKTLHDFWIKDQRERMDHRAQLALASHSQTKDSWDRIKDELDLRCLRDADVIGITTTGLARNLNMLRRLKSKVLICEEAGEVMEAHMLTSLLPSVEHLILIGDHQQLRPQTQNHALSRESHGGKQYALDRSLFERLVDPDEEAGVQIPFCTLETQRRMDPSISRLIRETLYPKLQDSPSVIHYPDVVGMRRRLFWLDHRHPEAGAMAHDPTATSHWNDHEIDLTVALVNHLLKQGVYQSGDIAVLTPYLGQLHRMRRKLAQSYTITLGERDQEDLDNAGFTAEEPEQQKTVTKSTLLQTLRVATVDNFQGEEAKVVVISLVRSNKQNRCGFLRTPNRINVLLSRAKHGMYIIGNSETSRNVEMWGKVLDMLEQDGNLGPHLELTCPRHPDTPMEVKEPEHFQQLSPEGGCSLQYASKSAEEDIQLVLMLVLLNAMKRKHVPHVPHHVMFNADIPDVLKNAPSHAHPAQSRSASHRVLTVVAQCLVLHRATISHVPCVAKNAFRVAINALRSSSSEPFSIRDINKCAQCRGSLRNISRYGRLVRRAMLDEATKKFILYTNQGYVPLAQKLPDLLSELQSRMHTKGVASGVFQGDSEIRIEGSPAHQMSVMRSLINKSYKLRWRDLLVLRRGITEYQAKVKVEEQPFNRVCNMVKNARQRKMTSGQFTFDESVLQTKGQIQASALLLRLDIALLSDFLHLKSLTPIGVDQKKLLLNLEQNKAGAQRLIDEASNSQRILQQAEGHIFLAQLYALESQHMKEPSLIEPLRNSCNAAIEEAQMLCDSHPNQTRGLSEEIEGTRSMLKGSFYTPVSNEERKAVLAAMAREFRSTGHWYYCENGHPFTIGECGGAMQLSKCPECGKPVGGQNHLTTAGVTHAHDLEQTLRDMQI
ncbi:hypothetical protein N7493_009560 [Penicillium malachiteum]|uniref:NFX1-type zinc finger-containing protein 1 n=1 Tax=Penicillium malachiteum TaxID=1324776 RepID=A0AAD6HEC6_9EURO|nr:hypothetical protein N7493_009560 [Penicillium malachiteum]